MLVRKELNSLLVADAEPGEAEEESIAVPQEKDTEEEVDTSESSLTEKKQPSLSFARKAKMNREVDKDVVEAVEAIIG